MLQSPPFESPATADLRNFEHYLEQRGLSTTDVDRAVKFRAAEYVAVRSGQGWEQIEATAEREKDSEWFKMSGYSPRSDPYWQTYKQSAPSRALITEIPSAVRQPQTDSVSPT
jgi:hypothetical protein